MTDELKACPFCSGKYVDYDSVLFTEKGKVIYAKCPDCRASFRVLERVYNTRPIEAAQAAEIERLNAVLDRIINYTPATIIDGGGNPKVPLHCVHSIQYIARAAREREVEG